MKKFAFLYLALTVLVIGFNNCTAKMKDFDLRGTSGGNPITVELAFAPYAPGSTQHDVKICLSEVSFDSESSAAGNKNINFKPDGTSGTRLSLKRGRYNSLKLKLTRNCGSTQSLSVTNAQGSFNTSEDVTLSFAGALDVGSVDLKVSLQLQEIVNALETVQQATEVKVIAESTTEAFSSQPQGWRAMTSVNIPAPRTQFGATWLGNGAFIWGGWDGGNLVGTGGIYDPVTDSWRSITQTGQPGIRMAHSTIWTGTEVIVWGGDGVSTEVGGRYNPATDSWMVTSANPVGTRIDPDAIWTGTDMIVLGGLYYMTSTPIPGGEIYHPATNTWTSINTTGMPSARNAAAVVWTGTHMLVWGGLGSGGVFNDGALYDPVTNTWTPISNLNAPVGRGRMSFVWTGHDLIVWGGEGSSGVFLGDGAIYDAENDTWRTMNILGAPSGRYKSGYVWTGSDLLVWGGWNSAGATGGGGKYNFASDTWTDIAGANDPGSRTSFEAIWTGNSMMVWGGTSIANDFGTNDGKTYAP